MSKHCEASPSSADRWMNCTASVIASRGIPRTSNSYADEGTCAHLLLEHMIQRYSRSEIKYILKDNEYFKNYFKEEMFDILLPFVDLVLNYEKQGAGVLAEHTFDISPIRGFGTVDCTIVHDSGMLEIADLKYGKSKVKVENNTQLKLYAYGAYQQLKELYDINAMRLTVFQPRVVTKSHKPIDSWDVNMSELLDWVKYTVSVKTNTVFSGEGVFKTGKWCWFCPYKADCKHLKVEEASKAFDTDDFNYEEEI